MSFKERLNSFWLDAQVVLIVLAIIAVIAGIIYANFRWKVNITKRALIEAAQEVQQKPDNS